MKVLCFGDSNTFGYIPGGAGRYDRYTRWPGQLQRLLGEQYQIIDDREIFTSDSPLFE